MLINEYLQLRGATAAEQNRQDTASNPSNTAANASESPFAAELKNLMAQNGAGNG